MEREHLIADKINEVIPDALEEVKDYRGERTLIIKPNRLKKVCLLLRDDEDLQYNLLSDIVGDDLLPAFPRFAGSAHLGAIPNCHRLRVRVLVDDPDKGPQTMAAVWPIATWLEMEVWDLMGIRFKGNASLRRLFLPEDWQGHPLRKDYPLGYEEVQFSFNWEEIAGRKPHPKE